MNEYKVKKSNFFVTLWDIEKGMCILPKSRKVHIIESLLNKFSGGFILGPLSVINYKIFDIEKVS